MEDNIMWKRALGYTALTIAIIGAINWGLIGLFEFNFVEYVFGYPWISRFIYALVGICGLYLITFYVLFSDNRSDTRQEH
jgi:uncharacterized membrane protein YuzA (DUF378 family)